MRTPLRILLALAGAVLLWRFLLLGWKVMTRGSGEGVP